MQLQSFHKKSSSTFVALHQKHVGVFIGKCLAMVTLRFGKSTGLCTISPQLVSPQQQHNYQLEKMVMPIPLLVFHLIQPLVQQNVLFTSYLSKTVAYLSNSRNFYAPVSSDKSIWLLVSSAFFEKIGLFVISGSWNFCFGSHCLVEFRLFYTKRLSWIMRIQKM